MISSGESMIDTARELKKRKANRIFVVSTFGLFTNGFASFDKAYEEGLIYRVVTTNLIYQSPELLSKEYYISCDMSKYIAYLIDTLSVLIEKPCEINIYPSYWISSERGIFMRYSYEFKPKAVELYMQIRRISFSQ